MAKGPRFPDAPRSSEDLVFKWGELTRILSQHLADDAAPYLHVDVSGSIPTSVSIDRSSYSLTATTDALARLLLSLDKAGIIRVRKT